MNILVTGAKGFVGKNLVANLKNIQENKNRTRPNLIIDKIFEYDIDTEPALLEEYCAKTDFVFNLAGVNRPKETSDQRSRQFAYAAIAPNVFACNSRYEDRKREEMPDCEEWRQCRISAAFREAR